MTVIELLSMIPEGVSVEFKRKTIFHEGSTPIGSYDITLRYMFDSQTIQLNEVRLDGTFKSDHLRIKNLIGHFLELLRNPSKQPISNRQEKINAFVKSTRQRWCDAKMCGCMGCINGSERHKWTNLYPTEAPITREEFDIACPILLTPEKDNSAHKYTEGSDL